MDVSITQIWENLDGTTLLTIALISALIGWATNWVAIQLTFYPVQFKGLTSWLGWQGIIPSKAEKMARISVDRTMSRLGDLRDVFQRLEPEVITRQIIEQVRPRLEEYIDAIMEEKQHVLWNNLPQVVRQRVYDWAGEQMPKRVEALMADFADQIGDLVDLKDLVVTELRKDPGLMNRIFLESGEKEFRFIIRSGFWFGLALGSILALVWHQYSWFWVLPIGGFMVGTLTNWIALNTIFSPVEPRLILGLRLQGLFLKRQDEVSATWSRLVASELITAEKTARAMVNGPYAARTRAIIQKHMRPALDQAGVFKLLAQIAVGTSGFAELKDALKDKAIEVSIEPFQDPAFNRERAVVVGQLIHEKMRVLPPKDFQDVLRPAFQEEEWQLILLGGLLGLVAGAIQYLYLIGS